MNDIGNMTADQEMGGQAASLSPARARSPCHQRSLLSILFLKIHQEGAQCTVFPPLPFSFLLIRQAHQR